VNDLQKDVTAQAPGMVGPRIPAPPPRDPTRRPGGGSLRGLAWLLALALGVAGGISAYQWVPPIDSTFDYWLSLALD
jgi:hypothetical protein